MANISVFAFSIESTKRCPLSTTSLFWHYRFGHNRFSLYLLFSGCNSQSLLFRSCACKKGIIRRTAIVFYFWTDFPARPFRTCRPCIVIIFDTWLFVAALNVAAIVFFWTDVIFFWRNFRFPHSSHSRIEWLKPIGRCLFVTCRFLSWWWMIVLFFRWSSRRYPHIARLRDDGTRDILWHLHNGHCPETLHPSLLRISREYWLGRGRHNLVLVSNIVWNATTSRPWESPRGNKEGTFLHYRVAHRTFLHYSLSQLNNLEAFAPKSRNLKMEVVLI